MSERKVSAHPEATIADSEYSLADIERKRARPGRWVAFILAALLSILLPYGVGRTMAIHHTAGVLRIVSSMDPKGIALISWTVTLVAFAALGMSIIESSSWFWRIVFLLGLAAEQLIAGLCLLKFNFWYGTYVVYQQSAVLANAANLGILAGGLAVAVFAVVFVAILIGIKKDSPLNVLTHSWSALSMFFVIELAAILIVLYGGLIN
ncbi:hypothetical protein BACT_1257 [Bifidobacterium actinocoloniiforme DSM 22766]|uniref:Teichoic acid transporter n=1 Tax=Bifidobacterium actinocoloniiforme DSM 22766 TaxID=1437605 RepID=A0A086Z203_9BIFI|nr:hypothetical protein [Bifidobacterium actinocoloniiforme]KFI40553.1 hypothetical protein BACT_1257 [Bifidobacterium actinocoloniiforme DSM 22766]